jgi:hypothetical protein
MMTLSTVPAIYALDTQNEDSTFVIANVDKLLRSFNTILIGLFCVKTFWNDVWSKL